MRDPERMIGEGPAREGALAASWSGCSRPLGHICARAQRLLRLGNKYGRDRLDAT